MDIENLQQHLNEIMKKQNSRSIPEFEGYSPNEMRYILKATFEKESPLKLKRLSKADYKKIPILNQAKYLLHLTEKRGEIKLTNKGFLPTKIVADIYSQKFISEEHIELGISKLYKETDAMSINLTRNLLEMAGLAKKRKGKLSLTKAGEKIIYNDGELLQKILETFTRKFNWAYYDGYGSNNIGQLGYGFSLILLSKYGKEKRPTFFYAEKYFRAFPNLLESLEPTYGSIEEYAGNCYSIRSFDRFLNYFGLVNNPRGKPRGIS